MFLTHFPPIRLRHDPGGDRMSCGHIMPGSQTFTCPIEIVGPIPKETSNGVVHGARLADTSPPRVNLLVAPLQILKAWMPPLTAQASEEGVLLACLPVLNVSSVRIHSVTRTRPAHISTWMSAGILVLQAARISLLASFGRKINREASDQSTIHRTVGNCVQNHTLDK